MNNKPLISIITVTYNATSTIEQTIQSVINQSYPNIEYIIIDGGSKDGTVDIIKKYSNRIAYWISEPDKGIYDAMNKGIKAAHGMWCVFMNSGDLLYNIPSEIYDNNNINYSAISFSVEENNNFIEVPNYNWRLKLRNTIPHQGLFYNLQKETVEFNLKYKIFSDYDLNLKLFKKKAVLLLSNKIVAYHDMNGISNNKKYAKEIFQVIKDNCGILFVCLSYLYFKYNGFKTRLNHLIKK